MQKRLSLRKNRPIYYQHLVAYVYRRKSHESVSYGFSTIQTNTPIMTAVDTKAILRKLIKEYGYDIALQSITPQGRVYV